MFAPTFRPRCCPCYQLRGRPLRELERECFKTKVFETLQHFSTIFQLFIIIIFGYQEGFANQDKLGEKTITLNQRTSITENCNLKNWEVIRKVNIFFRHLKRWDRLLSYKSFRIHRRRVDESLLRRFSNGSVLIWKYKFKNVYNELSGAGEKNRYDCEKSCIII